MADFEKAHPDLADATELSPDNPHAWESFEACLEAEGLEEKALECDRWALSLGGAVSRAQSIGPSWKKPKFPLRAVPFPHPRHPSMPAW